ncbi:MAG: hypothetical protein ICV51_15670, partial [Flavisolibacter sp.]|nr:hypothetical protein [Flavisolibacter sp.]
LPIFLLAQQKAEEQFTSKQITIDIGFTGIQVGAELIAGENSTFQFRSGLIPFLYNPTGYYEDMKWMLGLSFSGEYRFYYNFARRLEKGKDIYNNGANYVGILALYLSRPLGKDKELEKTTSAIVIGPMWGFNRPISERLLLHLSLGPALQNEIDNHRSTGTLYGDLRVCFLLNK